MQKTAFFNLVFIDNYVDAFLAHQDIVRASAPSATLLEGLTNEFMFMAIRASAPEVAISDIEKDAGIIRATPTIIFAGRRAALFCPATVRFTANGF